MLEWVNKSSTHYILLRLALLQSVGILTAIFWTPCFFVFFFFFLFFFVKICLSYISPAVMVILESFNIYGKVINTICANDRMLEGIWDSLNISIIFKHSFCPYKRGFLETVSTVHSSCKSSTWSDGNATDLNVYLHAFLRIPLVRFVVS